MNYDDKIQINICEIPFNLYICLTLELKMNLFINTNWWWLLSVSDDIPCFCIK